MRTLALGLAGALAACRASPATARDGATDDRPSPRDAPALDDATRDAASSDVVDATLDARGTTADVVDAAARDASGPPPVFATMDVPARRVFALDLATYVTGQDGSFWGWGSNLESTFQPSDGLLFQFGDLRLRPQRIAERLDAREMQFKGFYGICALTNPPEGGAVYCWGVGAELGFGSTDPRWDDWRFPHRMGTHSDVLSLAQGAGCVRTDRTYWFFRARDEDWRRADWLVGQLLQVTSPPVYRTAEGVECTDIRFCDGATHRIDGVVDVVGGLDHVCLLRADGHVMCWGGNHHAQVGNGFEGSEVCSYLDHGVTKWSNCMRHPTEVPGLTDVVQVAAGAWRTCARRRDGTVWCWGDNSPLSDGRGVLGDGAPSTERCVAYELDGTRPVPHPEQSSPCRRRPSPVIGLTDAVDISVGDDHQCAVRATGQVVCWGHNGVGQLGDGTTHDRSTPTPVRWY